MTTRSQDLRKHLTVEHSLSVVELDRVQFDELHARHAELHDHRGSLYHTSHKGLVVESRETRGPWRVVVDCKSKRHAEEVAQHVQHVRPGDMREQLISVRVEPAPPELTHNDARWWEQYGGRGVVYTSHDGESIKGVVSSANDTYVFVHFGAPGVQACDPSKLTLQGPGQ